MKHPVGAGRYNAAIGVDEDEERQLPDAPLLCKGAGWSEEVAIAWVVDGVPLLYAGEAMLVDVEGIADELDVLTLALQFASHTSGAVECALASSFPACPEEHEQAFSLVVGTLDGSLLFAVAAVFGF